MKKLGSNMDLLPDLLCPEKKPWRFKAMETWI
jgi:hypothetical protein